MAIHMSVGISLDLAADRETNDPAAAGRRCAGGDQLPVREMAMSVMFSGNW